MLKGALGDNTEMEEEESLSWSRRKIYNKKNTFIYDTIQGI